jgi:hypothetical protein
MKKLHAELTTAQMQKTERQAQMEPLQEQSGRGHCTGRGIQDIYGTDPGIVCRVD